MTPKQLNYFARIAESGSFSAASKQLSIAQSALSLQITKFEAELGVSLFFRKPRGVELTEAGERLLKHAYSIQRHIETALLDIQADDLEPEGCVRLGMIPTINNVFASELSRAVRQRFPKLSLEIMGGASKYLNRQLYNRRIDIALVHADSEGFGELSVTPIFKETLFFIGAKQQNYPHIITLKDGSEVIRFADIAHYLTLSTEAQDGLGFRIQQYEKRCGVSLKKRPSLGQLTSDLNEILSGAAGMILPWSAVYHLMNDHKLVAAEVIEPTLERDIYLLSNPKSRLRNNIVKTVSLIHELVPSLFEQGHCVGSVFDGAPG